jgi:uncharacterized protein (TIGR00369 family)
MRQAPQPLPEAVAQSTGAQAMQALAEQRIPHPEHYVTLGLRVVRAVKDRVELVWTPPDSLTNYVGVVHGGHTAMIFDEACCCAGVSNGERFWPMTTLNLTVDYLRAVRPGQTYPVSAEIVHAGQSRLLANATVHSERGDLVAQARATLLPNREFSAGASTEGGAP